MTQTWDTIAAEYADTRRGGKDARQKRPCLQCGEPTTGLGQVCTRHDEPCVYCSRLTTNPDRVCRDHRDLPALEAIPEPYPIPWRSNG